MKKMSFEEFKKFVTGTDHEFYNELKASELNNFSEVTLAKKLEIPDINALDIGKLKESVWVWINPLDSIIPIDSIEPLPNIGTVIKCSLDSKKDIFNDIIKDIEININIMRDIHNENEKN